MADLAVVAPLPPPPPPPQQQQQQPSQQPPPQQLRPPIRRKTLTTTTTNNTAAVNHVPPLLTDNPSVVAVQGVATEGPPSARTLGPVSRSRQLGVAEEKQFIREVQQAPRPPGDRKFSNDHRIFRLAPVDPTTTSAVTAAPPLPPQKPGELPPPVRQKDAVLRPHQRPVPSVNDLHSPDRHVLLGRGAPLPAVIKSSNPLPHIAPAPHPPSVAAAAAAAPLARTTSKSLSPRSSSVQSVASATPGSTSPVVTSPAQYHRHLQRRRSLEGNRSISSLSEITRTEAMPAPVAIDDSRDVDEAEEQEVELSAPPRLTKRQKSFSSPPPPPPLADCDAPPPSVVTVN